MQGTAKTYLFLVYPGHKSKMETASLSFPLTWPAGACVLYIGGIPWPRFPSPRGSAGSASIPPTVPQPGSEGGMGEGKE